MLRSQFFWKLYASYAVLVLLGVIIVGALVSRRIARETVRETEQTLFVNAGLLGELMRGSLSEESIGDLQRRLVALGTETDTRFTVIRADGIVIADSEKDPATMDNHANRPEVVAARGASRGVSTRFSRSVVANLMYVALPVRDGGELLGFARAAVPLTAVRERTAALQRTVALGGALAALVALLIGLFVAQRVTRPLTSITAAAEALARGETATPVETALNDEVGTVARAFNRMSGELQRRVRTTDEDRSKLLTILSGMVEGVVAVDRDQRIVHLNTAAARILGVGPSPAVGRPVWEVSRVRRVAEAIEETLRESREVAAEFDLEVGPQQRIVGLHGAPLRNGQQELVGAVLVLHDVTELRRLETVRRDFVANVSHELKTPITAIRGLIDTIVDHREMPPETKAQFLDKIQNQSRRLSLLVTDLLTLARLESAEKLLEAERVDLRGVARRAVDNFRGDAERLSVRLEAEVPDTPVDVWGDGEALELMVNNLLDNALKYTPEGGQVWVRLRADEDGADLEVQDTGIGIAAEHHDRVFERFYRVDKARSRELGGTGLGLSIVRHISKIHRGTVTLESAPAAGSTFRVRLPRGSPAA